jgi:SAM-dependent methyltransferase
MDMITEKHFYETAFAAAQWPEPESNFAYRTRIEAYAWKRFAFLALFLKERMLDIRTVAEIGCGDGCNLYPFHMAGKEVIGCDFDESYLEAGRARGIHLIKGGSDEMEHHLPNRADLVILSHVFEHFVDLDQEIKAVERLLKPTGLVYVEVPGIFSVRKWKQRKKEDGYVSTNDFLSYLQFPHHYHFSLEHLEKIWSRNGFRMICGDEWIRSVFVPKSTIDEPMVLQSGSAYEHINLTGPKMYDYLSAVEKDYQSAMNIARRASRFFLRRLV